MDMRKKKYIPISWEKITKERNSGITNQLLHCTSSWFVMLFLIFFPFSALPAQCIPYHALQAEYPALPHQRYDMHTTPMLYE